MDEHADYEAMVAFDNARETFGPTADDANAFAATDFDEVYGPFQPLEDEITF